jgi:hypothetical protein
LLPALSKACFVRLMASGMLCEMGLFGQQVTLFVSLRPIGVMQVIGRGAEGGFG